MKLLTKANEKKLPPLYSQENVKDPIAQVKFFCPWNQWTWYAAEYDHETGRFFGLVHGFETELGYFMLSELASVKGPGIFRSIGIERDMHFDPRPLSECRKLHERKLGCVS